MDFCIGTTAKIDAVDLVKQAENVGASHFGVGEGPLLFSDPYQYLALAARDTNTIKLGTLRGIIKEAGLTVEQFVRYLND